MNKIIHLDETGIKNELKELVRGSVEETLNKLLEEEADRITNANRYERTPDRLDTRAGHYKRKLLTTSGEVELQVPKLRTLPFETAIIERYQRRESSVEEALIEMYLAGVSVRRVEDITEALWGTKVAPATVSELNQKVYVHIEQWRNRPLAHKYPYVYLDGIYLKRNWGGFLRERVGAGGIGCERRWIPGNHRCGGGHERRRGELGSISAVFTRAGAGRSTAFCR